MNEFYFTQRLPARILAVFALFALIAAMIPLQTFAEQPSYDISANTPEISGLDVSWEGAASGDPVAGQVDDHGVCIDWDEDQDDSTHDWESAGSFSMTPGDDSFTATWSGDHTYTSPGTYTLYAKVHHANCSGAESDGITQATEIVVVGETGSLTIKKDTNDATGDSVAFDFTGDLGAFSVDGDNTDTEVFANAAVDTYVITESDEAGWDFGSVTCTGTTDFSAVTNGVSVDIADGENVTCTFTNNIEVTPTQCNDGVDNIDPEDELIDLADPGCDSAGDNDETDPAGPQMCTVTIVSDNTAFVVEKSANAIEITPNPAWTAVISGASWIWGDAVVVDGTVEETQTFQNQFGFVGDVTSATLQVASDNTHSATVNGSGAFVSVDDTTFDNASSYDVTSSINESGNNELNVAVTNLAAGTDNPAGALYKLTIEGEVTTDDDCVVAYIDPATLGTLEVTKVVVGTTTVDENAFSFKVDGGATTTFDGTDGTNTITLTAGTYDVVETAAPGYTTGYNNCDNVVVTAGQTSTCTITNTLITSTPQVCTVNSFSNTSTKVNGSSTFSVGNEPGSWVDNIFGSLAEWIWSAIDGSAISGDTDETDTFTKTFEWNGPVTSATLQLAADNMYSVTLNGTVVGADTAEDNYSSADTIVNISDNIVQGTNTLEISVTNDANGATTLAGNPAGLIYDLTVNGNTVDDCTPEGGGGDVLSCSISASDTSVRRGNDVTLSYSSNDATTASISDNNDAITDIGTTTLSGSTLIENLRADTTFTMTVGDGKGTATCSVFINVSSGGGGGGGGTRNNNDSGSVLGDSNSNNNGNDGGSGSVLGEQVSAIPLGAANAGAGGSSPVSFSSSVSPVAFLRRSLLG